jgi:predicted transcriptional regulator
MAEPITVRLNDELALQLRSLATFDRVTLADEIREAIALLVEARKTDPAYLDRVKAAFEEARQALVALEGTEQIVAALGAPFAEPVGAGVGQDVREAVAAG